MTTTSTPTGPNKLLIALIAAGGVLLLVVVALVFLLIGQNNGKQNAGSVNPTDSNTPIVTDSATPAPTTSDSTDNSGTNTGGQQAPPADNSLKFTSFDYNGNVECDETGQADEKPMPSISWKSQNANTAYWRPGDNEPQGDANGDNGYKIPTSGNQNDMSASKGAGERFEFPCNHRQYLYVKVTIVASNGQTVSKTAKFTDVNWNTGGDDDN